MTEDAVPSWQQPPPSAPKIKCPICGYEPIASMDPAKRWTTLILILENQKEWFLDTHVFRCERCYNIQSFLKLTPDK